MGLSHSTTVKIMTTEMMGQAVAVELPDDHPHVAVLRVTSSVLALSEENGEASVRLSCSALDLRGLVAQLWDVIHTLEDRA